MDVSSLIPFNPNDHRLIEKSGRAPVPLKPPESLLDLPGSPRAMQMPDEKTPKDLKPTFKDIYLHKREDLRKSSEGMESILVRQVLKAMRSSIPGPEEDEDLFGSASHATQMFTQMMDDELADKIAFNSDFGIAQKVFNSNINQVTQEFAEQLASGQNTPFGLPLPKR